MFAFFRRLPDGEDSTGTGIYWSCERANFGRAGLELWFVLAYTRRKPENIVVNFGRQVVHSRVRVTRWFSLRLPRVSMKWTPGGMSLGTDLQAADPDAPVISDRRKTNVSAHTVG